MSNRYFYIISSLPLLTLEEKPPLSRAQFLEICAGLLRKEDYRVVAASRLVPYRYDSYNAWDARWPCEVQQRWYNFEVGLRNQLVQFRASELDWNALPYLLRDVELDSLVVAEALREAFDLDVPLKLELRLMDLRWLFLNELEGAEHFDRKYLILYCIRLELLARRAQIEALLGAQGFKTAYSAIRERNREHLTI